MRDDSKNWFLRTLGWSGVLAFSAGALFCSLLCIWTSYRLFVGQLDGIGWWLLVGTSWTLASLLAAVPAGAILGYRRA